MDNILFGLRLASDEVKSMIYQKQIEEGISNDTMCVILRDLIGEFEAKRSNDYAKYILQLVQEKGEIKDGGSEDKTIS